ncbi:MAG TPA: methylmalonyl Co-A mutase-associated GTPase MeaB [Ignavibacteriaceae bacterium]|nr:methylmalonyl Co-A mutase-associated GTPase MeaB [Ignavibacteriaceae bacterium]
MQNLIKRIIEKDIRAAAHAISVIENGRQSSSYLLKQIYGNTGNAYRIGITGPPGAGKSTIVNQVAKIIKERNKRVGIIAVDPTSPFTGGALLGDRIRMSEIGSDSNIFIRSMASRGSLGGLSKKVIDAADVLDAAGYDYILLETVGVGQSELDIVKAADTTAVVLVPESGDSIQAMKAGLMEIADIFVLNKSDRPGSEQALASLKTILMMRPHDEHTWLPGIIKTVATENLGINDIFSEIEKHREFLIKKNFFMKKREKQTKNRIKEIVEDYLRDALWNAERENSLDSSLEKVVIGKLSPYQIAEELIENFKKEM